MAPPIQFDVSAIIVNWNTCAELESCLRSFPRASRRGDLRLEYIVVDNASADGSTTMVNSKFPDVRLIENKSNLGFAAGFNQGVREAQGRYLLILNPDILVREGALAVLFEALESNPEAGAVAPRLLNADGTMQKGYFRRYPSAMQVLLFYTFLAKYANRSQSLLSRYLEDSQESGRLISDVQQIPGGCMMLRREVIDTVGLMDESFLLFFEDVDYCYRMRKHGWKLQVVNTVSMVHLGGRSFRRLDPYWVFQRMTISLNAFVAKHGSLPLKIATFCATFGNSFFIFLFRAGQRIFNLRAGGSSASLSFNCHKHIVGKLPGIYLKIFSQGSGEDKLP